MHSAIILIKKINALSPTTIFNSIVAQKKVNKNKIINKFHLSAATIDTHRTVKIRNSNRNLTNTNKN